MMYTINEKIFQIFMPSQYQYYLDLTERAFRQGAKPIFRYCLKVYLFAYWCSSMKNSCAELDHGLFSCEMRALSDQGK